MSWRREQGWAMIVLLIIITVIGYGSIRLTMERMHQLSVTNARALADESLFIVKSWTRVTDYRCVNRDTSEILVCELALPSRILSKIPSVFTLRITPPPSPALQIEVSFSSSVQKNIYLNRIRQLSQASTIAPVLTITPTSNGVLIDASRTGGVKATSSWGKASNFNATQSSLILGGDANYGFSGC